MPACQQAVSGDLSLPNFRLMTVFSLIVFCLCIWKTKLLNFSMLSLLVQKSGVLVLSKKLFKKKKKI